jgi:hypothetical protein
MDRKTLEYLEDRAGKAREICNKIENLSKNIAIVEGASDFKIYGFTKPGVVEHSSDDIVDAVKWAYVQIAKDQMEKLEKELSEL